MIDCPKFYVYMLLGPGDRPIYARPKGVFRHTPESIERMCIAQQKRKPITEETRAKMRIAAMGNKSGSGRIKSDW